jgi:uncharacterized protein Yka (UPF0111/DUF47 family)
MALTNQDKQFIKEQLKPLAQELTELSARVRELERATDTLAFLGKNSDLRAIEKRTARIEGKLDKLATKEDVQWAVKTLSEAMTENFIRLDEQVKDHSEQITDMDEQVDKIKRHLSL